MATTMTTMRGDHDDDNNGDHGDNGDGDHDDDSDGDDDDDDDDNFNDYYNDMEEPDGEDARQREEAKKQMELTELNEWYLQQLQLEAPRNGDAPQ